MSLENYHITEENQNRVEFDQYNRPYIQEENGRFMLSARTNYNYNFKN